MKLIVGLGNPGAQYEKTRHNAGFMAIDRLLKKHAPAGAPVRQRFGGEAAELNIAGEKVVTLKPMRFMNCSGASVAEAIGFYKLELAADVMVLVDDYALPLGTLRIRGEGSSGGHNGLSDIERALGTAAYPRMRIGIDGPPPGWDDQADWVLGRFTDEQLKALSPALDRAADAVAVFVSKGLTPMMNQFNVRPKPPAPPISPSTSRPQGPIPTQTPGLPAAFPTTPS